MFVRLGTSQPHSAADPADTQSLRAAEVWAAGYAKAYEKAAEHVDRSDLVHYRSFECASSLWSSIDLLVDTQDYWTVALPVGAQLTAGCWLAANRDCGPAVLDKDCSTC